MIFVLGDGLIGTRLQKRLKAKSLKDIDQKYKRLTVRNVSGAVDALIKKYGTPRVIVNAIGVIGKPNVEWCEIHREETFYGNVLLPVAIARVCKSRKIPMIHISTGCIFNDPTDRYVFGIKDVPNFNSSFYSYSKMECEKRLRNYPVEIHRIRMPFFGEKSERNIFDKLLKYSSIVNTHNSMTSVEDYVEFVAKRVMNPSKSFVVFHAVNRGSLTHKEVLDLMEEHGVRVGKKKFISIDELQKISKTPRSNCRMGDECLPDIVDSMHEALTYYVCEE